jgi:endo-1,4-beta-xylanase
MSVPTPHKALGRLIARFFLPVLMVLVSCAGTPVIRSADSTAASSSVFRDSPGADGLAGIYSKYFPIGAAVNSATITSARDMLSNEFSMLTAENEMKPSIIHPRYGTWHFYAADEIADYARKHGMTMRGHCFVWHSQTPGWFFSSFGEQAGAELLWERLGEHIGVMAERYGDVVEVWDVANEVISDDRGEFLRPSPYLDILGDDYVAQSFLLARQILPDARLFYNDYSVLDPVKQDKIFRLLEDMLDRGIPVDGIGIQGHWNIYQEDLAERLDRAIVRFAGLGLEVQVTEMDLSMYRHEDIETRYSSPPPELLELQARRYAEIFAVLRDRSEMVTGVTFWGVSDEKTWLDNFPVSGRKNWPLLFDEEMRPKLAYTAIIDF